MDLIAWFESHLTLIGAVVTVAVSALALWRAADNRGTALASGLTVLETKLDAHSEALKVHALEDAQRTEIGFSGVNRRLDLINGNVMRHEREIGKLLGKVEGMG